MNSGGKFSDPTSNKIFVNHSHEQSDAVPGTVISHIPQSSGCYVGSPSLLVLASGAYLASHDIFGPNSAEWTCPITVVYRSLDQGITWQQASRIEGLFWANLFTHRGAVYAFGVDRHHGHLVIRRSEDDGSAWSEANDATTGRLTERGEYHTAPVPVVEHEGRLWRAFEDASNGERWGERYCACMASVPIEADLLHAGNWTFTNSIARDPAWLNGDFRGWLEGNAVVDSDGNMVNVLRVDTPGYPEKAALVAVSPDATKATFDPQSGFIDFPGGAKKFTVRYDVTSGLYWSITSVVPESYRMESPNRIRNTLALTASPDLRHWQIRAVLLHHPDTKYHGFQYVDWRFDGSDMIAVCRTAYEDNEGGAHNHHDANYLTFHRIADFRASQPIKENDQCI